MGNNWIDVDLDGLAKIAKRRGLSFVLLEMLQNSYDEDGCSKVTVTLDTLPGVRNRARLTVEDDGAHGFRKLSDAWTMFAPSYKAANPEQAGRFNLGCKLVLALCEYAIIETTTGSVAFDKKGRRKLRRKRERGSSVRLMLKVTQRQVQEIAEAVELVIPRVETHFRMQGASHVYTVLKKPELVRETEATLPTEFADSEGNMRRTSRKTSIEIYEPVTMERGWIYELGLPVVPTGDTWSVNVNQTVPLGVERENVTPQFLRKLRAAVLNAMADQISEATVSEQWVREAASAPEIKADAYEKVLDVKFGEDRVMFDPSDPEANSRAAANGYTVVHPRQMSAGERFNRKRIRAETGRQMVRPSGHVFPTHGREFADANIMDMEMCGQKMGEEFSYPEFMELIQKVSTIVLGYSVNVQIANSAADASAWYGSRTVTFNYRRLGKKFFTSKSRPALERLLDLTIHELAHAIEGNHLSDRYYRACTKLGAKLTVAALCGEFDPRSAGYGEV